MLNANEKLEEAAFFLEKMRETHSDSKPFDHYLNAFISSCRSVQWVLSSQFNGNSILKAWLADQQPTEAERQLLKATNDLRVRSTKIESVSTAMKTLIAVDPTHLSQLPAKQLDMIKQAIENRDFSKLNIQLHHKDEGYSVDKPPAGRTFLPFELVKAFREVSEFPNNDVLEIAEKYYSAMQALVVKATTKLAETISSPDQ